MRKEIWDLYYDHFDVMPVENNDPAEIGIADSIQDPAGMVNLGNQVGRTISVRSSPPDDPSTHGAQVASILDKILGSRIHFFQFTDENGNFRDRHLMSAIGKAKWHGEIDILNISAGSPHIPGDDRNCTSSGADCPLCEVAESAIEEGITIVAAAGNSDEESVYCPSLSDKVISVGGMAVECAAETNLMNDSLRSALYKPSTGGESRANQPPNAIWIDRSDEYGTHTALCGGRGCFPGESCSENQIESPYIDNYGAKNKPDVLAPCIEIREDDYGPLATAGTSYAAPFVTTCVANTMQTLKQRGATPLPREVLAAIRRSSREISDCVYNAFSHNKFIQEIGSTYSIDLELKRRESSSLFDTSNISD